MSVSPKVEADIDSVGVQLASKRKKRDILHIRLYAMKINLEIKEKAYQDIRRI
jgi:hypothetical protein